jgi:Asp-tRNA(Asn)/Glu-tRNA(Gln) amidotransferase A subunit family amidase
VSAPASTVPELATASAGEVARRIAAKEVTSREVVEALLERIEAVNPEVQAIRVVLADAALAAADEADGAVAVGAGLENGLPQGVQVIGPRFREDLCLDAAQAIETALGTLTPIDPR